MKEVIVQIPDKEYPFFMELVKKLPFVKVVKAHNNVTKAKVLSDLQESIHDLKLIKAGKKKGISAKDLIKEL
jgi:hypothetical protein